MGWLVGALGGRRSRAPTLCVLHPGRTCVTVAVTAWCGCLAASGRQGGRCCCDSSCKVDCRLIREDLLLVCHGCGPAVRGLRGPAARLAMCVWRSGGRVGVIVHYFCGQPCVACWRVRRRAPGGQMRCAWARPTVVVVVCSVQLWLLLQLVRPA